VRGAGCSSGPVQVPTLVIIAAILATLFGCASGNAPTTAQRAASRAAGRPLIGAAPTPHVPATVTLASCAPAIPVTALHAVHHFAVSPDDVAVDAAGRLWVTAREANLLFSVTPDGTEVSSQTVDGGPEGVAVGDAGVEVAQQNLNTVAAVSPTRRTIASFPNRTGNVGIDGVAVEPSGRLLVPDSPTGELFGVSLSGAMAPQLIAADLGRPVAAAMDPAGDILVASEAAPGLVALSPTGGRRVLGHFGNVDDVVAYAGLVYVTDLDHHDVVAVDPTSGASAAIAVHLPAPQGLAVTATGTLEIVDATTDTLYSLPTCKEGP
jgi:sugar lactone lactonase YvrE